MKRKVKRGKLTQQSEKVNLLLYGDGGRGKTTALASLANLGKVVYVDAEAGLKRSALQRVGIPVENIEIVNDLSFDKLEQLFWDLKGELEDNPDAIAGVVLDTMTELQKKILEGVVLHAEQKAERLGKVREAFSVYKEDWGVNTEMMRNLIRKFRDLPCHVGFAAWTRRDEDDDGVVTYGPALTPGIQTDLFGYVDIVGAMQPLEVVSDDEQYSWANLRPAGKWKAKDRYHATPQLLVNPMFDRIIAYVEGTLTAEIDPAMEDAKARRRKAREERTEKRKRRAA